MSIERKHGIGCRVHNTGCDGDCNCGGLVAATDLALAIENQLFDDGPRFDMDVFAAHRDAGYRAGWNDRARSLIKALRGETK